MSRPVNGRGRPPSAGLQLVDLSVGYGRGRRTRVVLDSVVAQARRGEFTALLGPNGCGKSTILRTVMGLQPALGGRVLLDGSEIAALSTAQRARTQAVVLTERVTPGALTARELVGLGRHPHTGATGRLTAADRAIVMDSLAAVDGDHLADRDIAELSDGERQRVMTARALAQQPTLLLLDEPSAFLDAPSRVALTGLLRRLAAEQDMVVVVSTHEVEIALRVADRVWLIDQQGVLIQGTPERLVMQGHLNRVFDSADLAFDTALGGFTLLHRSVGRLSISEDVHPVVASLAQRLGWTVEDDDADVHIGCLDAEDGESWWVRGSGGTATATSVEQLEAVLRAEAARSPSWSRADPTQVRAALSQAGRINDYFAVRAGPARSGPTGAFGAEQPVRELAGGTIIAGTRATSERMGVREQRVGVSSWHLGLAARIWSAALGAWACASIVPDLANLAVDVDEEGRTVLRLASPAGWVDAGTSAQEVAARIEGTVRGPLTALSERVRGATGLAAGVLDGNVSSAAVGTIRALQHHNVKPTGADLDSVLDALVRTCTVRHGLRHPETARTSAAATGQDPAHDGARTAGQLVRRSCCLYYRTPQGGFCGDCPLHPNNRARQPQDTSGTRHSTR